MQTRPRKAKTRACGGAVASSGGARGGRVIYRNGGCAHLAIRVCGALQAGLGDEALEVGRDLGPEAVDAGAVGRARRSGGGGAVERTRVGDAGPAPGARGAQGAGGVLGAGESGQAIARIPAGALRGRDGVAGALGGGEAARTVGIGGALLTGRRAAVVAGHAGAVVDRVGHRRREGVCGAQPNDSTGTEGVGRAGGAGRASGCVALVAGLAHALLQRGASLRRGGVLGARQRRLHDRGARVLGDGGEALDCDALAHHGGLDDRGLRGGNDQRDGERVGRLLQQPALGGLQEAACRAERGWRGRSGDGDLRVGEGVGQAHHRGRLDGADGGDRDLGACHILRC